MDVDERIHARRWWALAVLGLTLIVISLDNTVLNVALPSLIRDLNASNSDLQWIIDGYTLVFAGLLLTAGSIGDRFGRRGALQVGLAIFGLGSTMSALATSPLQLTLTRAFMGIGAALIMPATLSLITNIFTNPKERARAIGVWAALAGAGGALGPIVGGVLLAHFWWGSVFLINIPVTVVAMLAGRAVLPVSKDPAAPRLDPVGAVLSVAGLVALLYTIIEAPNHGWGSGSSLAGFAVSAAVLFSFGWWELHCDHPMLDLRFFRNARFSAASGAITLVFFSMLGVMFIATQYLQLVLGYSPLQAGVRQLPGAAIMLMVGPMSPRIVEKLGTKTVVASGLLVSAASCVWLSMLPATNGYLHFVIGLVGVSGGMGLIMAPATESVMGSLPRSKAGVGSAMNDTTRQMGGAIGVAVIGSVLSTAYRPGVTTRLRNLGAPTEVTTRARESLGRGLEAAAQLPSGLRQAVTSALRGRFVDAIAPSMLVPAGVLVSAAVMVVIFLPAHAPDRSEFSELDALASMTFAEAEGALENEALPTLVPAAGNPASSGTAQEHNR